MIPNLETFRETVLADARHEAERMLEAAARDAEERLKDARAEAGRIVERARAEGRAAAARETRRRQLETRQEARTLVLREQRGALERLREVVLKRLREHNGTAGYERLMDALEQQALRQLGAGTEIETDGEAGGFVARHDSRSVDYRLPVLVDRALDALGARLEELWR